MEYENSVKYALDFEERKKTKKKTNCERALSVDAFKWVQQSEEKKKKKKSIEIVLNIRKIYNKKIGIFV